MKKLFGILLAVVMVFSAFALVACGNKETAEIAMITDSGDVTDRSFNQTTWEAVQEYAKANQKTYKYYKPAEDSTSARVDKVEEAVGNGAKVIVMPGYLFAGAVIETCQDYPDVKFIVIDCGKGDYLEYGVNTVDGGKYDYNPDNPKWDVTKYVTDNVYSIVFQEEQAGYLAGYAAVKDGETKLGFLGGMAVPAVQRFGFGYIQGVAAAAAEKKVTVDMWYAYGGQFFGNNEITNYMKNWKAQGVKTIFASGGGIYTSVVEALGKDGKLIGVDTDQSQSVEGITVLTSAMKGLGDATKSALDIFYGNKWDTVGGKIVTLGLKAGETQEYVGLPTADSSWNFETFTVEDYKAVVAKIRDGSITISNDTTTDIKAWIEGNANLNYKDYNPNILG